MNSISDDFKNLNLDKWKSFTKLAIFVTLIKNAKK